MFLLGCRGQGIAKSLVLWDAKRTKKLGEGSREEMNEGERQIFRMSYVSNRTVMQ